MRFLPQPRDGAAQQLGALGQQAHRTERGGRVGVEDGSLRGRIHALCSGAFMA